METPSGHGWWYVLGSLIFAAAMITVAYMNNRGSTNGDTTATATLAVVAQDLTEVSESNDEARPTKTPTPGARSTHSTAQCRVTDDYQLFGDETFIESDGAFIHVEYWWDGDPERETVVPGGRHDLQRPIKGWVWEYSEGCTEDRVRQEVDAHIERRQSAGANNDGFVEWTETGVF